MDHHLNVFRFFNESPEKVFIENNLSRAFSICLANDSFLLGEYVRGIVTPEDYSYLFSTISSDTLSSIDIQIDTTTVETESYRTVYAVAMTTDKVLNMDDFLAQKLSSKKNITDIFISIKDIAIIIEVKRTGEDCREQLFNQVYPFLEAKVEIRPINYSWHEVINLLERVENIHRLNTRSSVFIKDFLELSEIRYPEWFEPKPFNTLQFSDQHGSTNYNQLQKRIRQALAGVSIYDPRCNLLSASGRLGVALPYTWTTELIPEFHSYPHDAVRDYVAFYVWPANTKQQGHHIYNKPLDWTRKTSLKIEGVEYELEIVHNVKLSHYRGKYISGINFSAADIRKPLHTVENFYSQSGKWDRDKWKDFERLMDEHFKSEFNWREHCQWEKSFPNSDRNYLFMSLGFEVCVFIPFSKFKTMDKKESDIDGVSKFIYRIVQSIDTLID